MANSVIVECADCGENFCTTCDLESSNCSDCKQPLCEACAEIALDERKNRCYSCHDPELSVVRYPAQGKDFKLHKHYHAPVRGTLRD